MAESILTSINLAGGSFNVYYDTVLAIHSDSTNMSALSVSCPSNWKAAIINIATNTVCCLYAMPVFNVSNNTIDCYIPSSGGGYFSARVNQTSISSPVTGHYVDNAVMTVIFLA